MDELPEPIFSNELLVALVGKEGGVGTVGYESGGNWSKCLEIGYLTQSANLHQA